MIFHAIIFILALVGIGDSLYLNYERKRKRPPVCVIGHDCGEVWASPYSRTFGLSNEVWGIVFYGTMLLIEWLLIFGNTSPYLPIGEWLALLGGSAMSLYFVYLQWRVIKAWCFWCTLSAVLTGLMLLVRVALW